MKYRMYVDEVGNPDLASSTNPNHRFLSLTGVIIDLDYVRTTVVVRIERMKQRLFDSHPDDPVILHRKELVNKKYPFESLRDPDVEGQFNKELLAMLDEFDYTVLSTTIDKLEHQNRYQTWRHDPYHYCLEVLIERYVMWLQRRGAKGDVMAESRGGKEDRRLKRSFRKLCDDGSRFISPDTIQASLTSVELKVKPKANNIAGLQIADVIAHPIYKAMASQRGLIAKPQNFGSRIYATIESKKLDRSPSGEIDGWGLKWLP